MIKSVFFDLDGTLADTAPDLATSLNQLLQESNRPMIAFDRVRPLVSLGAKALLCMAFNPLKDELEFERLEQRFLDIYRNRLHQDSELFSGMEEVLTFLESHAITWGVISNKPERLSQSLIAKLGLTHRAICVLGGDSTAHRKPHPAPILRACQLSASQPETSLYVGDAEQDMKAGQAAGTYTLAATWGYIPEGENPQKWNSHGLVRKPEEIIQRIESWPCKAV